MRKKLLIYAALLAAGSIAVILLLVLTDFPRQAYNRIRTERQIMLARGALSNGEPQRAAQLAAAALRRQSQTARVANLLGEAMRQIGDARSVLFFKKAVELEPENQEYILDTIEASTHFMDYRGSLDLLRTLSEETKKTLRYHRAAATLSNRIGLARFAESHFQQIKTFNSEDPEVKLELASWFSAIPNRPEAPASMAELERLSQQDDAVGRAALQVLVRRFVDRKQGDKAIATAERLTRHPKASFRDNILLLTAYHTYKSPKFDSHYAELKEAKSEEPIQLLAAWMLVNGKHAEGVEWIGGKPDSIQASPKVSIAVADLLAAQQKWSDMETRLDTYSWGLYEPLRLLYLARALHEQGRERVSAVLFNESMYTAGSRLSILLLMLRYLEQVDQHRGNNPAWVDEQVEILHRVATIYPSIRWAPQRLVDYYGGKRLSGPMQEMYTALAASEEATDIERYNYALLSLLLNAGSDNALRILNELYDKEPENPHYIVGRAFALYYLGQFGSAAEVLDKLKPEDQEDKRRAAYATIVYAAANRSKEADEFAKIAEGISGLPEEEALLDQAAQLERFRADPTGLQSTTGQADDGSTNYAIILGRISQSLKAIRAGQNERALATLSRLNVSRLGVISRLAYYGTLLEAIGRPDEARPYLALRSLDKDHGLAQQLNDITSAWWDVQRRFPQASWPLAGLFQAYDARDTATFDDELKKLAGPEEYNRQIQLIRLALEQKTLLRETLKRAQSLWDFPQRDDELNRLAAYTLALSGRHVEALGLLERLTETERLKPSNAVLMRLTLAHTQQASRVDDYLEAARKEGEDPLLNRRRDELLEEAALALALRAQASPRSDLQRYRLIIEPIAKKIEAGDQDIGLEITESVARALASDPRFPGFRLAEISQKIAQGELVEARQALSEIPVVSLDTSMRRAYQGNQLLLKGEKDKGLDLIQLTSSSGENLRDILRHWVEADKQSPSNTTLMGLLNTIDALDQGNVIALAPSDQEAIITRSLVANVQTKLAADRIGRLIRRHGSTPSLMVKEAYARGRNRDTGFALRTLGQISDHEIVGAENLVLTASTLISLGEKKRAKALLQRIDPREISGALREMYVASAGSVGLAVAAAESQQDRFASTLRSLLEQNNAEPARLFYRENAQSPLALLAVAAVDAQAGQKASALQKCNRLSNSDLDDTTLRALTAILYLTLEDKEQAAEFIDTATSGDSSQAARDAWRQLREQAPLHKLALEGLSILLVARPAAFTPAEQESLPKEAILSGVNLFAMQKELAKRNDAEARAYQAYGMFQQGDRQRARQTIDPLLQGELAALSPAARTLIARIAQDFGQDDTVRQLIGTLDRSSLDFPALAEIFDQIRNQQQSSN